MSSPKITESMTSVAENISEVQTPKRVMGRPLKYATCEASQEFVKQRQHKQKLSYILKRIAINKARLEEDPSSKDYQRKLQYYQDMLNDEKTIDPIASNDLIKRSRYSDPEYAKMAVERNRQNALKRYYRIKAEKAAAQSQSS